MGWKMVANRKYFMRNFRLFSTLFLSLFSCNSPKKGVYDFFLSKNNITKIEIYCKNESEEFKLVTNFVEKDKIENFKNLFEINRKVNESVNDEKISTFQPKGRILFWISRNEVFEIEFDLICCFRYKDNNVLMYENFTYRSGRFLKEILIE